jgi:hypothetical protein
MPELFDFHIAQVYNIGMDNPNTPYSLAWNGTSVHEKRELLKFAYEEKTRRLEAGKTKDAYLGLASTCVDILGTAKAAIAEINKVDGTNVQSIPLPTPESMDGLKKEWKSLHDETAEIARDAIKIAGKEDKTDWAPSDYEVIGTIILRTGEYSPDEITEAVGFYEQGIAKAEEVHNIEAKALLQAQLVRAAIETENSATVDQNLRNLYSTMRDMPGMEAKHLTRLYRAFAEGAKYLAVHYAQSAGSENQELKAKNI